MRHFLFALAAVVGVPLASLALVEGGLRLAGFGYDPSFLVARRVDGRAVYTENPRFGWRFFPKDIARGPQPFVIDREKAAGTLRVFVLGESAAMGDPAPAYGIPRMLQAMLEVARPDARVEVVNASMTAINSHVIRVIARDCLEHGADALVVYAGNNEVVGPFGVGSVFGIPGADRALVHAIVAVRAFRIGQLADAVVERFRPPPPAWTGMEQFLGTRLSFEDPRLQNLAAAFRGNLEDVCARARARGVPVVLGTMAVNLRSGGPFGSEAPESGVAAAWHARVAAGDSLWASGDPAAARAAWGEAAGLDPRPAELSYRLACADLPVDPGRAAREYAVARDRDLLRFRCDSRLGAAADSVASGPAGAGVHRVDVRAAVEAASPWGIPGRELFDDHVHFNFDGNYVAARALAAGLLPLLPSGSGADTTRLPDRDTVARRLGYGPSSRYSAVTTMIARHGMPPFPGQWDAAGQTAFLQAEADSLRPSLQPHAMRRSLAEVEAVVHEHTEDRILRGKLAALLAATGNLPGALDERREARDRYPWDPDARYDYAQVLQRMGRRDDAVEELRAAVRLFPGHFLAQAALGDELAARGDLDAAERHLRMAVLRYAEFARAWKSLGDVLLRRHRAAEAESALRRAVTLEPGLAGAHKRRGDALFDLDRKDEAEAEWLRAVAIHPAFAAAHARLAELYRARGEADRATDHERRAKEAGEGPGDPDDVGEGEP